MQFGTIREFAALIGSSELVTLLVGTGYFLGLSAGYLLSDRLPRSALTGLGAGTLLLQMSLPFSARWAAGFLASHHFLGAVPPLVFVVVLGGLTPFYAVFLPRLIEEQSGGGGRRGALLRIYAAEIAGAFLGLLVVLTAAAARMGLVLALNLAALVTLVLLTWRTPRPAAAWVLLALPAVYFAAWGPLDTASLRYFYKRAHGYLEVDVLASEFSPYQRVDLIQGARKNKVATYLYLNGNLLYGTRSLHQHNLLVSLAPNLVRPSPRALVIAGGSLDNARYLAPRVANLHVVELDEAVVRLTREHLQEPRGNFPTNWQLVIDDGKHFLGAWSGAPFDVISVDVPVPTQLQTAMLHSERFFALARSRLAPGGIFSISLAGKLTRGPAQAAGPQSRLAPRIVAGLLKTFPYVTVVRTAERDYAWAGDRPVTGGAAAVQSAIDRFLEEEPERREIFGAPRVTFVGERAVAEAVAGAAPIGEADMQVVLRVSWRKLMSRYYPSAP